MDQYQQNLWTHSQKTKVVTTDKDLDSFLLNLAGQSLTTFNYQYLAAASALTNGEIVAWFNNQFYHTASLALNLVHNAIIRALINPAYSIHVANAPFDYFVQPNSTNDIDANISLFSASFTIEAGVVMSLVSASYVMFYIQVSTKTDFVSHSTHHSFTIVVHILQEKVCRAKFLQYASGTNLSIFWLASILWDVFTNMVTVAIIVIMLAFSRQPFWADANTVAVIGMLFTVYNVAMMPVICLTSLIFSKPTTGVNVIFFGSLIICRSKLTFV